MRKCPNCYSTLEALKKFVRESFPEKTIAILGTVYRPMEIPDTAESLRKAYFRRKRFAEEIELEEETGRSIRRVKLKILEYEYYCPRCNAVYPMEMARDIEGV